MKTAGLQRLLLDRIGDTFTLHRSLNSVLVKSSDMDTLYQSLLGLPQFDMELLNKGIRVTLLKGAACCPFCGFNDFVVRINSRYKGSVRDCDGKIHLRTNELERTTTARCSACSSYYDVAIYRYPTIEENANENR